MMSEKTMTQSLRDALDEIRYAITCPVSGIPEAACLLPLLENAYAALQAAPQQVPVPGFIVRDIQRQIEQYKNRKGMRVDGQKVHIDMLNAERLLMHLTTPPTSATVEAATIERCAIVLRGLLSLEEEGMRGPDDDDICYEVREACALLRDLQTALASQPAQTGSELETALRDAYHALADKQQPFDLPRPTEDTYLSTPHGEARAGEAPRLSRELVDLRHDIERQVQIGADLANEVESLRAQLAAQQEGEAGLALLERLTHAGWCPSLIYDDNGNWAVLDDGMQNIRDHDDHLQIMWFAQAENFKPTIREALAYYVEQNKAAIDAALQAGGEEQEAQHDD